MSSGSPSAAELIRAIARAGSLDRALASFPGFAHAEAVLLLEDAARSLQRSRPRRGQAARASGQGDLLATRARADPGAVPRRVSGAVRVRVASDGAARGNPGPAGAGAVIWALPSGEVLERLGRFLGRQTNNVAEYEGVLLGLRRARALGAEEIEVVADSQLLIRQLGGRYQVKSPGLKPLHLEAVALLEQFRKVKLVHVPREQNKDADVMSNRAIDERM